jgi:hypothetical protein
LTAFNWWGWIDDRNVKAIGCGEEYGFKWKEVLNDIVKNHCKTKHCFLVI